MIRDFFFVLKMFVITLLIVFVSQVKIGQKSLEDHFQGFIKNSMFVDSIQEAVDGGIALTKVSYKKIDLGIHGLMAKLHSRHIVKDRGFHFSLKRYNEKDSGDQEDLPQAKTAPVKAH